MLFVCIDDAFYYSAAALLYPMSWGQITAFGLTFFNAGLILMLFLKPKVYEVSGMIHKKLAAGYALN